MPEVLTKQYYNVGTVHDIVEVQLGPQRFLLFYQVAFDVAAGLQMAARLAARYEGVHPSKWVEFIDATPRVPHTPKNRHYRRSGANQNFTTWSVAFEHNLVVINFDQEVIKLHYTDAYKLHSIVRAAARNAKAWAGDTARQWTTRGSLADAEENDKFVYV